MNTIRLSYNPLLLSTPAANSIELSGVQIYPGVWLVPADWAANLQTHPLFREHWETGALRIIKPIEVRSDDQLIPRLGDYSPSDAIEIAKGCYSLDQLSEWIQETLEVVVREAIVNQAGLLSNLLQTPKGTRRVMPRQFSPNHEFAIWWLGGIQDRVWFVNYGDRSNVAQMRAIGHQIGAFKLDQGNHLLRGVLA